MLQIARDLIAIAICDSNRGSQITTLSFLSFPKGPRIEKIQDRPPGLKFSIEIENFNLDTQQTPIFCGEF